MSVGLDREFAGGIAMAANVLFVRGFNQVGNLDYNLPNTPVWRQYTSWGRVLVPRTDRSR